LEGTEVMEHKTLFTSKKSMLLYKHGKFIADKCCDISDELDNGTWEYKRDVEKNKIITDLENVIRCLQLQLLTLDDT
jgi:hypothetical protein